MNRMMQVGMAAVAALGVGVAFSSVTAAQDGKTGLEVGDQAPGWALQDEEGKTHSLSDYRGKIVVMDFWATWCGPCKRAMPGVQELHEQFKDRGVKVFGIDVWDDGDAAGYMEENDYTYGLLLDGDPVAERYNVTGIPTFYVIGFDGEIIFKKRGFQPSFEKQVAEKIEEYLEAQNES